MDHWLVPALANRPPLPRPPAPGKFLARYEGLPSDWVHMNQQFGVAYGSVPKSTVEGYPERIPSVLVMMKRHLVQNNGRDQVGIFRLAPDRDDCDFVKNQINSGTFESVDDVNVIANLIKVWFRDMPSGLLNTIEDETIYKIADLPTEKVPEEYVGASEGRPLPPGTNPPPQTLPPPPTHPPTHGSRTPPTHWHRVRYHRPDAGLAVHRLHRPHPNTHPITHPITHHPSHTTPSHTTPSHTTPSHTPSPTPHTPPHHTPPHHTPHHTPRGLSLSQVREVQRADQVTLHVAARPHGRGEFGGKVV